MKEHDIVLPRHWDKAIDRLGMGQKRANIAIKYIPTDGKHLDIGTGQGQFLEMLRKNGINCFGMDYGFLSTKICKERGFNVVQADGRSIPFKDNTFESISLLDVIEHVPCPEIVLENISYVLKLKGLLIISTPNAMSLQEILLRLLRKLKIISYKQPYDIPIPLNTLKKMIYRQGFKITSIKRFGFFRYFIILSRINRYINPAALNRKCHNMTKGGYLPLHNGGCGCRWSCSNINKKCCNPIPKKGLNYIICNHYLKDKGGRHENL